MSELCFLIVMEQTHLPLVSEFLLAKSKPNVNSAQIHQVKRKQNALITVQAGGVMM